MSRGPDFFDLVGDEGSREELQQLRRAHDLLVAAGPPPELSPHLAEAPGAVRSRSSWAPRRRRGTAFLLAAGVAAAMFGIGFLVGGRGPSGFQASGPTIRMHAATAGQTGRATILIGDRDTVGNWPLLVRVSGLEPLPKGHYYSLYLTDHGKITEWCGAFAVNGAGRTTVRMSVPYKLKPGVGWVVTSGKPAQRQVLLTT